MEISEKLIDGINFITFENSDGFQITFSSLGAGIFSILIDGVECLHHPMDEKEYLWSLGYYGKTVGRIAGRVKNSIFILNNKTYFLDKNDKGNCLHSGSNSLAFKKFTYKIKENYDNTEIIFEYKSPDMEGGFPGVGNIEITYIVSNNSCYFKNIHKVVLNNDCPISLTNHAYFHLGEKNGNDLKLSIPASLIANIDDKLIIKNFKKITPLFDFKKLKIIENDAIKISKKYPVPNGYDHTYLFDSFPKDSIVILKGKQIELKLVTNYPAINIYSNCYTNNNIFENNTFDKKYCSIALEPQNNILDLSKIVYGPNKPYLFFNEYIFRRVKK